MRKCLWRRSQLILNLPDTPVVVVVVVVVVDPGLFIVTGSWQ